MKKDALRTYLLSLERVEEKPHFDRMAYRVKRIFATVLDDSMNVKLTAEDQQAFCTYPENSISAVPNKWGLQGWTTVEFEQVEQSVLEDLIQTAWYGAL